MARWVSDHARPERRYIPPGVSGLRRRALRKVRKSLTSRYCQALSRHAAIGSFLHERFFWFESFISNQLHGARRAMAAALPLPLAGQRRAVLNNLFLPRTSSHGHSEAPQLSYSHIRLTKERENIAPLPERKREGKRNRVQPPTPWQPGPIPREGCSVAQAWRGPTPTGPYLWTVIWWPSCGGETD